MQLTIFYRLMTIIIDYCFSSWFFVPFVVEKKRRVMEIFFDFSWY